MTLVALVKFVKLVTIGMCGTLAHDGTVDQVRVDLQLDPANLDPVRSRVLLGPVT